MKKHEMKTRAVSLALTLMLALSLVGGAWAEGAAAPNSVGATTAWRYSDSGVDPAGDSAAEGYSRTSWTLAGYDDSAWASASGTFGAKNGTGTDLGDGFTAGTLLSQYKGDGTDKEAFFFRTTVNVADPAAVTAITGSVVYDDAAIVYINGTKVAGFDDTDITENMQYGGSNASAPQTGVISVTDAAQIASLLVSGSNTIAVELHQGRSSSSDIYFAMPELTFSTGELPTPEPEEVEQSSINLTVGSDETQMNFTWFSTASGTGTLKIAKQSQLVDGALPNTAQVISVTGTAANKTDYTSYQTTVTGLEPGTTYAYQLVNGETVTDAATFTTGTSGAFSFVLAGDPQIGTGSLQAGIDGWSNTLSVLSGSSLFRGVNFLLSAGDQVDSSTNETQYDGYLEHSELASLPMATLVGNHDSGSDAYDQHFYVPNESSLGATAASADYYFVYNNVLFLCLNSNNTSTAEHQSFMESAIAATANEDIQWKVVSFHHSIYSVANHATESGIIARREALVPVFEALDIDVVLMGHDHVYCRTYMMEGLTPTTDAAAYDDESMTSVTDPTGILYITANSASGSKYYNIQTSVDFPYAAVMSQEYTPNISRVDVSDNQFKIVTYRTSDLSVVDEFTINRTAEYDVTVETPENGSACADVASAAAGTIVNLTATADAGYHFVSWLVNDGAVTVTDNAFEMPDGAVTVKAVFEKDASVYTITAGANGVLAQGAGNTLSFTADGAQTSFTGVKVDGKLIDAANYTVASGSTVVTLKADYLNTLSPGDHTITIVYTDGEASATFTVKAAVNSSTSEPANGSDGANTGTSATGTTAPKTVDASQIGVWFVVLMLACAAAAVLVLVYRKHKKA